MEANSVRSKINLTQCFKYYSLVYTFFNSKTLDAEPAVSRELQHSNFSKCNQLLALVFCVARIIEFVASSLWSESEHYSEENTNILIRHIDEMSANYGGTEILEPLKRKNLVSNELIAFYNNWCMIKLLHGNQTDSLML